MPACEAVGKPPTLGYDRRWRRKASSMRLAALPGKKTWTVLISVLATLVVVFFAQNLTTGEKRVKEKLEHRYAIRDAQFQRTMGVMLGPVILPGNRFATLLNGDEIFPAMLQAIKGAQKTITFETYIYWSGDIGKAFADALSQRARAGVKVHVLLDWLGSSKIDSTHSSG